MQIKVIHYIYIWPSFVDDLFSVWFAFRSRFVPFLLMTCQLGFLFHVLVVQYISICFIFASHGEMTSNENLPFYVEKIAI